MCPSYTVQAILPWDWCEECEFECWTLILGLGSLGVKVWEGFIFGSGSFMLSSRCEGSKIFIFSSIIRRGDGGNSFWTSLNQSPVTAFSFSENKCDEMFAKLFRITVFIAGHTPPSVSPFTFTALKHFSPLNCSGIKNEPSELSQDKSNRLSPAVLKSVILTGMKKNELWEEPGSVSSVLGQFWVDLFQLFASLNLHIGWLYLPGMLDDCIQDIYMYLQQPGPW